MDSSKKHIDFLDQMRGIAIVAVFLFHALGTAFGYDHLPWGSWIRDFNVSKSFLFLLPFCFGWSGVASFFVVSGFCIHLSFSRHPNWRDFAVRRFFRIYPPYFFAVLLFGLFLPWSRIDLSSFGLGQLGSHLALIHNYYYEFGFGISPAFWSIAVEVQLYFLYPVLLGLVAQLGWHRSLLYIAALEIGLRILLAMVLITTGKTFPLPLGALPFLYWYSWSIGAAVADAYLLGRPIPFANHSIIAWAVVAIISEFVKPLSAFSFLFFAVLTATLIAKLLRGAHLPFRLPTFFSRSLSTIGVWSYSIYLLHQPLLALAPQIATKFSLAGDLQALAIFMLCLCIWFPIVGLSALWYRAFELPNIALSRQIIKNMSSPQT